MYKQIQIARVARKTKSDQTKQSIFLRVRPSWKQDVKEFTFSTKICIEESKWNDEKKQIKGASIESQRINIQLNKLEEQVYQLFAEYLKINPYPKLKEFKRFIEFEMFGKGTGIRDPKLSMNRLFDHFLESHQHDICDIRKNRYKFVGRKVNEFNMVKYGRTDVELDVISYEWRKNFKNFLKSKVDYKPSTLNGYIKVLHSAIRFACKTGKIKHYPFVDGEYEKVKEEIRYLTLEELQRIENFKIKDERIMRAVKLFLFACNTGLAYSDLRTLQRNNIDRDTDGILSIKKRRDKTNGLSFIPLNNYAISILNEFKSHPLLNDTNLLLPMIHLNDYNKLLKTIAIYCKIEMNLTSHIARHTFATTVWINNEGTMEGLKGALGHDKIDTTEKYGKVLEDKIKNDSKKVFANQAKKGAFSLNKIKMSNPLKNEF
jgi:integrase